MSRQVRGQGFQGPNPGTPHPLGEKPARPVHVDRQQVRAWTPAGLIQLVCSRAGMQSLPVWSSFPKSTCPPSLVPPEHSQGRGNCRSRSTPSLVFEPACPPSGRGLSLPSAISYSKDRQSEQAFHYALQNLRRIRQFSVSSPESSVSCSQIALG